MSLYIALGVGGVLGVYGRYGLTQLLHNVLGDGFPIGTLVVNVLGTFVLAFLFVFTLERLAVSPALRAGMMTGGLGAFTTFSTFVVEALMLVEDGEVGKAALYLTLSIGLGMAAAFAGLYLGRNL